MRPLSAGALLALCACAAGMQDGRHAGVAPERIALELNSWGRPILGWEMDRSGAVEFRRTVQVPGGGFGDYDVAVSRFSAGVDGFQRVRAILQPIERDAGRAVACETVATDMPYGQVSWTAGGTRSAVSFNFGCHSRAADRVLQLTGEAETAVEQWAETHPVAETRQVRTPGR